MYCNLRQKVVTNCVDRRLLQNAATLVTKCVASVHYKILQLLLQNAQVITKCASYYKMRKLLQNAQVITKCASYYKMRKLLQNAQRITKCASYYKMPQPLLQNAQVITKCRRTAISSLLMFMCCLKMDEK